LTADLAADLAMVFPIPHPKNGPAKAGVMTPSSTATLRNARLTLMNYRIANLIIAGQIIAGQIIAGQIIVTGGE
jgi:hypothetical protein